MILLRILDIIIVGGGIIGCAVAREIKQKHPGKSVILIEKESVPGAHASSRNSDVIHSGFNLKPGSLKARLCVRGSRLLRDFCRRFQVPMQKVGTVVVALEERQMSILKELERRGRANSVPGVELLNGDELRRREPYARGVAALFSPTGTVVSSPKLVSVLADEAMRLGVVEIFKKKVERMRDVGDHLILEADGSTVKGDFLVNCAGLYADRVAWMMDVGREYLIVPFRGDYYRLRDDRTFLVNSMIYEAPPLELPFLGTHLTKRIDGSVILGPNASLAFSREHYRGTRIDWQEALDTFLDRRFLRLITDWGFFKVAINELKTSFSKSMFTRAARALIPSIQVDDLELDQSGIRAQLVDRNGHLVDDFRFERTDKSLHILNAVSPGMTSALAFAEYVRNMLFNESSVE